VLCQDHSDRFAADFIDHSAPHGMLGQQADRPACTAFRRRPAHKRNQGSLLRAVELRHVSDTQPRLFAQCVLKPFVEVAMRDPRDLSPVSPERRCRRVQCHAAVQHQQRLHPSPDSRRPLLACTAPTAQLPQVGRRQPQPFEPLCALHLSL
jgi:hypothetical protein